VLAVPKLVPLPVFVPVVVGPLALESKAAEELAAEDDPAMPPSPLEGEVLSVVVAPKVLPAPPYVLSLPANPVPSGLDILRYFFDRVDVIYVLCVCTCYRQTIEPICILLNPARSRAFKKEWRSVLSTSLICLTWFRATGW
jgi:hypothetical protein